MSTTKRAPTVEQLLAANSSLLLELMANGQQPRTIDNGNAKKELLNGRTALEIRMQLDRELERKWKTRQASAVVAPAPSPEQPPAAAAGTTQ